MVFKRIILFVCVHFFITITNGDEECVDEVNKHQECLEKIQRTNKAVTQTKQEKITSEGLDCFKRNNCTIPSEEDIKNSTDILVRKQGLSRRAKERGFPVPPDGQKQRDCFNDVLSRARADIEKCVQEKNPNFKFPTEEINLRSRLFSRKQAQRREVQSRQGLNYGNLIRLVEDSCPNESSRESTKKCLEDSFQDRSKNPEQIHRKAFDNTLSAEEQCFKKISSKCRVADNETNNDICECAKQIYKEKKTEFENDYDKCSGAPNPSLRRSNVGSAKTAQYHGSGVEFMVTSMCQQPDLRVIQIQRKVNVRKTRFISHIIIGNQYNSKAEVYQLTFTCDNSSCAPLPLEPNDLLWSSPDTPGISEVKFVYYKGRTAILCTTQNGAIVYEYPSGLVLFQKEIESSYYINVHSAEVLPDGNVIVAGSVSDGIYAILYPDGNQLNQSIDQTVSVKSPFGHGVVYDKSRGLLYAGGYLNLFVLQYSSGVDGRGSLKIVQNISLAAYYDEPNKNENGNYEDGVHDLYPAGSSYDTLFLSTGEHVFTINVETFQISRYTSLYTIPSQKSKTTTVTVPDKGGVKGVSMDYNSGVVLAKPAPWFKELFTGSRDKNYSPHADLVVWTMPNKGSGMGYCPNPDYDTTNNCKIDFSALRPIWFYKIRFFMLPAISNWVK